LISSLFVIGCGSKSDAAAAAPCTPFDYTKYTPTSTSVSLTTDLAPIIKTSCTTAKTCHGATGVALADNEPQLGLQSGIADMAAAMKVQAALVGVDAKEAPGMKYVVSGDPEHSWIMKKLEGSQNCVTGVTCMKVTGDTVPSACGDRMPSMQDNPLPADQVQKFRDWIKAGAAL
jgi:hypothetical protein